MINSKWANVLAALASGALLYTSINSLGWAFSERDRYAYAAPMLVGVAVAVTAAL